MVYAENEEKNLQICNKVTAAYGEAVITSYGNYNLYEYFYEGATKYILRFAVGKDSQKVEYIGVRLRE